MNWDVLIILLVFIGLVIVFIPRALRQRAAQAEAWKQFAQRSGLLLNAAELDSGGSPASPVVSGEYRGRRVSLFKDVTEYFAYDGSIPVVHTVLSLGVENAHDYQLAFQGRSFKHRGDPPEFVEKALRLLEANSELFNHRRGATMLTEAVLTLVNWKPPSIILKGRELTCTQSGVPTDIPHQVELLNVLCDLAELAERP